MGIAAAILYVHPTYDLIYLASCAFNFSAPVQKYSCLSPCFQKKRAHPLLFLINYNVNVSDSISNGAGDGNNNNSVAE